MFFYNVYLLLNMYSSCLLFVYNNTNKQTVLPETAYLEMEDKVISSLGLLTVGQLFPFLKMNHLNRAMPLVRTSSS